ncbi:hypothetical protein B0J18DRAFT_415518 [Chaetomium sp. MPI-SDFR-AT-0129]|nr:hypothetical protein B0J18DRAFT_415518 [Chaetomium sp. MPI-SDFR-AT-0129]
MDECSEKIATEEQIRCKTDSVTDDTKPGITDRGNRTTSATGQDSILVDDGVDLVAGGNFGVAPKSCNNPSGVQAPLTAAVEGPPKLEVSSEQESLESNYNISDHHSQTTCSDLSDWIASLTDGSVSSSESSTSGDGERVQADRPNTPPPALEDNNADTTGSPFRIGRSHLGGLGIFATRELKRDETVWEEAPLLRTTHGSLMMDYSNLSDAAKKAYMSLRGAEGEDRFTRVEMIKQLNGFALPDGVGIFETASRFNHACSPVENVGYTFDEEHDVLTFTVCQDVIPAGAELLVNYGASPVELYSNWGFRCACGGCTPLTDRDIWRMRNEALGIPGDHGMGVLDW